MFERFTDRARRVIVLAQEEARLLSHNYIGTEHILLGLIHEDEGVAAKVLESMGIGLGAVRQQIEEITGRGREAPSGHIPFTPRAKKVLEFSLRESNQLGHEYIGTEHILLGLVREGDGLAAQVLVRLGADLERTRQQVIELLHGRQGEGHGRPGTRIPLPAWSTMLEDIVDRATETIMSRLGAVDARLAAIERHLSIASEAPSQEGTAQEGTAREGTAAEAAADGGPGHGEPPGQDPAQEA